jgi:hypothetical protein
LCPEWFFSMFCGFIGLCVFGWLIRRRLHEAHTLLMCFCVRETRKRTRNNVSADTLTLREKAGWNDRSPPRLWTAGQGMSQGAIAKAGHRWRSRKNQKDQRTQTTQRTRMNFRAHKCSISLEAGKECCSGMERNGSGREERRLKPCGYIHEAGVN